VSTWWASCDSLCEPGGPRSASYPQGVCLKPGVTILVMMSPPITGIQSRRKFRGWRDETIRVSALLTAAWSGVWALIILVSNLESGCFDSARGCEFWWPFFGWVVFGPLPGVIFTIVEYLVERETWMKFLGPPR